MLTIPAITLALMVSAAAPRAQAETCSPPPELAAWREQRPIAAGRSSAIAPATPVGSAVRARLHPAGEVAFPVRPAEPGPGAYAGLLAFDVSRPGRYRVALGERAWIEVVANGRAISSAAHAHGAACAGIAKQVDFDLRPGRHYLELAGAPNASAAVLVTYVGVP